jgi:hypothetical protein
LHLGLQPFDLHPQFPHLPIARFPLAPLPDVATKTLDVYQDLLVALRVVVRRFVRTLVDAGPDVVLQLVDLRAQRSNGIAQLGDRRVIR